MRPALLFNRESVQAFVSPGRRAAVYRIYHGFGLGRQLLYVGASASPRERLLAHLRNTEITEHGADLVELEFFRTTTAMARAEREAIQNECPLLDCGSARRHHTWKAQAR